MEQIIKTGSVTRGWIGVAVQDMTQELAESFKLPQARGALISEVLSGSPADKAGVKPGDILIAVNDKPVTDSASMLALIATLQPGQQAELKVIRGQAENVVKVTIGKTAQAEQRREESRVDRIRQTPGAGIQRVAGCDREGVPAADATTSILAIAVRRPRAGPGYPPCRFSSASILSSSFSISASESGWSSSTSFLRAPTKRAAIMPAS